jgi:hypothetical protein
LFVLKNKNNFLIVFVLIKMAAIGAITLKDLGSLASLSGFGSIKIREDTPKPIVFVNPSHAPVKQQIEEFPKAFSIEPPIYDEIIYDKFYRSFGTPLKPANQRDCVESRVVEIQKYLQQHRGAKEGVSEESHPILGGITICRLITNRHAAIDNTTYIIDGQHRLEAIRREFVLGHKIKFLVICYATNSLQGVEQSFSLINLAVPLADYLKEPMNEKQDSKIPNAELIKQFENHIRGKALFVDRAINRPRIDPTNFMNRLRESPFFNELKTIKQFEDWLQRVNLHLKCCSSDPNWLKKQAVTMDMLIKCKGNGTYFGLVKQFPWMNDRKLFYGL